MKEDRLLELEKPVETAAKARNFTIFKTNDLSWLWSYDESDTRVEASIVIEWREGEGWEEFLNAAAAMGANTLYTDARKFSWNDLVERIDNLSTTEEISKRKKQAEAFSRYDGFVEQLIITFRADGIWHAYQETEDWLPKYLELLEEPEEAEEGEFLSEEMLENFAEKLAQNPAFPKLKNKSDQPALAKRIFAKEDNVVLENLDQIVARARVIYQSEVSTDLGPKGRRR